MHTEGWVWAPSSHSPDNDIGHHSHHNLCCNRRLPDNLVVHTVCRYTHMYCHTTRDLDNPDCNIWSPGSDTSPNLHTTQTRATISSCLTPSHTVSTTQYSLRPTPHSYSHILLFTSFHGHSLVCS
jgi:hypothetical protein